MEVYPQERTKTRRRMDGKRRYLATSGTCDVACFDSILCRDEFAQPDQNLSGLSDYRQTAQVTSVCSEVFGSVLVYFSYTCLQSGRHGDEENDDRRHRKKSLLV